MREFIENKSRKPTEVTLFGDTMLVDLKSTDCIRDYTRFMLKRLYKQRFGITYSNTIYVDRKNGNIQLSNNITSYWSVDIIKNIKNLINSTLENRESELTEEAEEVKRERDFVNKLKAKYPDLRFDGIESYNGGVKVETRINGLHVTIDSDWEIDYTLPDTKRNVEKIMDFLQNASLDVDYDDDDDDE